ncbi:MAG: hypothetical protein IK009_04755 [Bacteroidales bacterium]|nr:hypothetical protein [Bacteroidales bacterium]
MNDVELFAACLKDLLLENDVVVVPGLGSFMTRLMPASFSDLGRTINPPYRKLSFRAAETGDASLFINKLAAILPEGTDVDKWLSSFVAGFKEALDRTKRVELASLGAMRATAQNDYFFVASEDLDIYPEGMGLEPVTIKSSALIEFGPAAELSDAASEPAIELELDPGKADEPLSEPEPQPEPEPAVIEVVESQEQEDAAKHVEEPAIELESEPASADEPAPAEAPASSDATPAKKRRRVRWWAVLLIVLAVILLFLILSVIFKDQLPWGDAVDNIINHILYTEEELRILNS